MNSVTASVISNNLILNCLDVNYYLMRVNSPAIARECKPGQFVMIRCGKGNLLRRPLSIHRVHNSAEVEFLFSVPHNREKARNPFHDRQTGQGSGCGMLWLSRQEEDSSIDLIGPLGNGFSILPSARKLLLVAGGIGIAPLVFLAEYAKSLKKSVIMLIGAKTSAGLYPEQLLPSGIRAFFTVESGRKVNSSRKGRVTDLIDEYIHSADQVFACGPQPMYRALDRQTLPYRDKISVQVSLEVRMGCGFGACYGCSVKTKQGMKRVCKEGPVFDIEDIIWQEVKI